MKSKYYIYNKEKLLPATASRLLDLIKDKNPQMKESIDFSGDLLPLPESADSYEILKYNIILNIISNKITSEEKTPSPLLVKDDKIKEKLDTYLEHISQIPDDKITEFFNHVLREMPVRRKIQTPDPEAIHDSLYSRELYKSMFHSLEKADSKSFDEELNESIEDHINAKKLEFELNQIKTLFYNKLLEPVVIFHPEQELFPLLEKQLKTIEFKDKALILDSLIKIHQNEMISDGEKISRYIMIMKAIDKPEIKTLLNEYFFTNTYPLALFYQVELQKSYPEIKSFSKFAPIILKLLAEKTPLLYEKSLKESLDVHQNDLSKLYSLAKMAHQLSHKASSFKFFKSKEDKEIPKVKDIIDVLDKFYLGEISCSTLKEVLIDKLKEEHSHQISLTK